MQVRPEIVSMVKTIKTLTSLLPSEGSKAVDIIIAFFHYGWSDGEAESNGVMLAARNPTVFILNC